MDVKINLDDINSFISENKIEKTIVGKLSNNDKKYLTKNLYQNSLIH